MSINTLDIDEKADNPSTGIATSDINRRTDNPGIAIDIVEDGGIDNQSTSTDIKNTDRGANNLGTSRNIPDIDREVVDPSRGTNTSDINNTNRGVDDLGTGIDTSNIDKEADPGTSINIADADTDGQVASSDKAHVSFFFLCKALFFMSHLLNQKPFLPFVYLQLFLHHLQ